MADQYRHRNRYYDNIQITRSNKNNLRGNKGRYNALKKMWFSQGKTIEEIGDLVKGTPLAKEHHVKGVGKPFKTTTIKELPQAPSGSRPRKCEALEKFGTSTLDRAAEQLTTANTILAQLEGKRAATERARADLQLANETLQDGIELKENLSMKLTGCELKLAEQIEKEKLLLLEMKNRRSKITEEQNALSKKAKSNEALSAEIDRKKIDLELFLDNCKYREERLMKRKTQIDKDEKEQLEQQARLNRKQTRLNDEEQKVDQSLKKLNEDLRKEKEKVQCLLGEAISRNKSHGEYLKNLEQRKTKAHVQVKELEQTEIKLDQTKKELTQEEAELKTLKAEIEKIRIKNLLEQKFKNEELKTKHQDLLQAEEIKNESLMRHIDRLTESNRLSADKIERLHRESDILKSNNESLTNLVRQLTEINQGLSSELEVIRREIEHH